MGIIKQVIFITKDKNKEPLYKYLLDENTCPVWERYTLTVPAASQYFSISERRLREMISEDPTADYIIYNGRKILIKRIKFEEYLNQNSTLY